MDNTVLVSVAQALGHLLGDVHRFGEADRALFHPGAELGSLQKLHRHVGDLALLAEIVDRDDLRMAEPSGGLGFEEEARLVFRVRGRIFRENDGLERDGAVESGVFALVDDPHRAAAEFARDFVAAELRRSLFCHG